MSTSHFEKLDGRTMAVELEMNGGRVLFSGVAAYESAADLGPALKIHVTDPAGDFDLLLREDCWKGDIKEDHRTGCDFHISLTASDLCAHIS